MTTRTVGLALVVLALVAPAADANLTPAAEQLLRATPGLRVSDSADRVVFYGKPMNHAETPEAAAAEWLEQNAGAFGHAIDLVPTQAFDVHYGEFTVFWYTPTFGGTPLEEGQARVLVRNDPDGSRVVYAACHELRVPDPTREDGGYPAIRMRPQSALAFVRTLPEYHDVEWQLPELVILNEHRLGDELVSVRAWRVTGSNHARPIPTSVSVYVDAAEPRVAAVRNNIHHVDIEGDVSGLATPGLLPDTFSNPPIPTLLQRLEVTTPGGESGVTDSHGSFTIPFAGTGPVDVSGTLAGPWVAVNNSAGPNLSVTESVTPPGPLLLELNPSPSEFTTAQVNGFVHTNLIHDMFKEFGPDFTPIDIQLPCNVNLADECNAFFDSSPLSMGFFNAGGGCVNTAFSSVVAHEYGHFIVNRLGLSQGAFGEGFGDTMAIVLYGSGLMGQGFEGPGTVVRDIPGANVQYPCPSTAIHFCGQILGGCWYDMKIRFEAELGGALGLDATRQLAVDWAQITLGGQGSNSAHPDTAIEVLTMDDDDGDIENGTPNYELICEAFAAHSIDCPPLPPIAFVFPDGRPELVDDSQPTTVRVDVIGITSTPLPDSAVQHVSFNGGPFTSSPMTSIGVDEYLLTVPAMQCGDTVEYFVTAESTAGDTVGSPADAPATAYFATMGDEIAIIVDEAMETDPGWTVGAPGDDATTGIWERVDPNGTAAQPGEDHTDAGTLCWVTGQAPPGSGQGTNDVDDGSTTLLTAIYDVSGGNARISYWRWYANDTGASPGNDVFVIEISNQGGAPGSWVEVETVGPDTEESSGGWFYHEFWVADLVPLSDQVQLRFIASDLGSGSIVEAAIDDFRIEQVECLPSTFVRGDCNQDAQLAVADAVLLLAEILGTFPTGGVSCEDACDANDDGLLDISDAVTLLNFLFVGGTTLPAPTTCGEDPGLPDALDCELGSACD